MPKFDVASHFSLHSVDHDRVLLDESSHNARNLLGESSLPKELKLSFTVNGEKREANLFRELGAFTNEVKLTTVDEKGEYQSVPLQEEHFAYYSEDRSWVLTFHGDEKFDGLVFEDGGSKIHHFIGKQGKLTVDGNVRDYFPGGMKTEGRKLTSEAQNGIDYWSGCHGAQSSGLGQMNIGAAIGTVMVKNFGVNGAIAEYNSYMTLTNMIYERQMDIRLKIDDIFVAENANQASWGQSSCQQSIQTQLNNMRFWNPPSQQVIWHLLDDCFGFSGGVLGIAYLGTLCSSNNVGVNLYSDDVYTSTQYPTWATVAHEIGHNFDAQHSFEDGQGRTGGIMDYGFLSGKLINGEVQFNTKYRRTEVCREVNTANNRGCIIRGVAPSPTGQLTVPEPVESLLEAPRDLSCVKHRLKVHNDAAALRAIVDANSEEECKTACAERAECNAFSVDRDNYCQLYQGATEEGLAFSSKFTTFLCAEGEVPVSFTEQEIDDALEGANLSSLKEECCASTPDATFLGMNMNSERSMNKEECELACIQNSRCEATSFDTVSGCMMYGGREFTHQKVAHQGSSVLSCDRPCISAVVGEPASTEVTSSSAAIVGSVLVAVGFVGALVGGVFYYKKRKTTETVATEGAVLKATL